jgi:hypothetical protein
MHDRTCCSGQLEKTDESMAKISIPEQEYRLRIKAIPDKRKSYMPDHFNRNRINPATGERYYQGKGNSFQSACR